MNNELENPVFSKEELENEEMEKSTNDKVAEESVLNESTDSIPVPDHLFNESYFAELDKLSEEVESANYIELTSLKKTAKKFADAIDNIGMMVNMVEQLNNAEDNLAKQIAEGDVLEKTHYSNKYDNLREEYTQYKDKANSIINRIDERISEETSKGITSKYLTTCLNEILEKKINNIKSVLDENPNDADPHLNSALIIYNEVAKAFSNRDDLSWIIEKSKDEKFVNKIYKNSKVNKKKKNFAKYIATNFKRICSAEESLAFNKFIQYKFNDSEFTDIFMYFLAKIYHIGRLDGTYAYAKIVIMNILDIMNGIYDISDDNGDHVNAQLKEIYDNIKSSMILDY